MVLVEMKPFQSDNKPIDDRFCSPSCISSFPLPSHVVRPFGRPGEGWSQRFLASFGWLMATWVVGIPAAVWRNWQYLGHWIFRKPVVDVGFEPPQQQPHLMTLGRPGTGRHSDPRRMWQPWGTAAHTVPELAGHWDGWETPLEADSATASCSSRLPETGPESYLL